jgi:hypothetical protein
VNSVPLQRLTLLAAGLGLALALSGCAIGGSKTTTVTVTRTVTTPAGPKKPHPAQAETGDVKYFGTPVSVTQANAKDYLLVLRPEFFLVGVTANVAFAGQQSPPVSCAPLACPGVPDDRWVIPAGTEDLTFVLPATTTGTVLTLNSSQMQSTKITAAQLSALVGGAKTPKLMEALDSGLWLTVDVDTVTSFAQQFQP